MLLLGKITRNFHCFFYYYYMFSECFHVLASEERKLLLFFDAFSKVALKVVAREQRMFSFYYFNFIGYYKQINFFSYFLLTNKVFFILFWDRLPSRSNFSHFLQFLSGCKTRVKKNIQRHKTNHLKKTQFIILSATKLSC